MRALAALNGDESVYDDESARIRVPARGGSRTLMAAMRALDEAGVEPTDIALHKPTLDDVFLALTGDPIGPDTSPETAREEIENR